MIATTHIKHSQAFKNLSIIQVTSMLLNKYLLDLGNNMIIYYNSNYYYYDNENDANFLRLIKKLTDDIDGIDCFDVYINNINSNDYILILPNFDYYSTDFGAVSEITKNNCY